MPGFPGMARSADFHIDRDGVWRHRGSIVQREAMVRLFASMLRRRGERYVLVTPEQVLRVDVDDAPFVIIDAERVADVDPPQVVFITNTGERFALDTTHPLYVQEDALRGESRLYQRTRDGIPALVHRNVFYRLVELAEENEAGVLGVRSAGAFFPLEMTLGHQPV